MITGETADGGHPLSRRLKRLVRGDPDVVQEIALAVCGRSCGCHVDRPLGEALYCTKSRCAAAPVLLSIGRNKWFDKLRRKYRDHETSKAAVALDAVLDHAYNTKDPALAAIQTESLTRLEQAIGSLSSVQQQLVVGHFFNGLTFRALAADTGLALATVHLRLNNALAKLRPMLDGVFPQE